MLLIFLQKASCGDRLFIPSPRSRPSGVAVSCGPSPTFSPSPESVFLIPPLDPRPPFRPRHFHKAPTARGRSPLLGTECSHFLHPTPWNECSSWDSDDLLNAGEWGVCRSAGRGTVPAPGAQSREARGRGARSSLPFPTLSRRGVGGLCREGLSTRKPQVRWCPAPRRDSGQDGLRASP